MDIGKIIFIILAIIYVATLLIVGILLLVRAHKTNLKNLIYGGIGFILASITLLLEQVFNITFTAYIILTRIGTILAVLFTNLTFHREKKEILPKLILFSTIGVSIINAYFYLLRDISNSLELYYVTILTNILILILVYGWLGWSSYFAYIIIKNQDIEPWIKKRYKLTFLYSIIIIPRPLALLLKPWNVELIDCVEISCFMSVIIAGAIQLVFSVAISLTWIMPGWFKKFLNRGYELSKDKEPEKREPVQIINFLGDYLAEKINFSPSAARGMIKLAIRDQLGAFMRFEQITLKELKSVIQGSLKTRLLELKEQDKINLKDIDVLTKEIIDELIKGQALITMANV
ncbi:MAG: hypothetical protein ACFFBP_08220 [Promethearchaeota archaeon]